MPDLPARSLDTRSEQETIAAGRDLAARLAPGALVLLSGPLGAGKTAFVRGMAEALGIDPRQVHSPSFAILNEYVPAAPGDRRLVHVDLYRLESEAEIEDLGLPEYLSGQRIMAVEWGERMPARLRRAAVLVTLEDLGDERRRLTIECLA